MAVPTFTTDLVDISTAESTTNWDAVGTLMTVALSTDFFRQGAASVAAEFKGALGRRGVVFDNVTGIDFTVPSRYLYIWLFITSENTVEVEAGGGVRVYVSSAATDTDYNEYTVGGSDAAWVGKGWKLFVVDVVGQTPDFTVGTPDLTSLRRFGATADMTVALGKADGLAVDVMRYGGKVELTGGTAADPITFQTIADEDAAIGSDTHYGVLYDDATGNKLLNGGMVIGDEAGASNTYLQSSNEVLLVTQERVPKHATYITVDQDLGTTTCQLGSEVGTGDNSAGVGGGLIRAIGTARYLIDAKRPTGSPPLGSPDRTFTEFSWWGGTIQGANAVWLQQSGVKWVGCSVTQSGQIVLDSGATMRDGFIIESTAGKIQGSPGFVGSPPIGVGAILLNSNPTDPEFRDMTLINNKWAIESETDGPTTLDLRNIQFAGNTGSPAVGSPASGADIIFNHASGLLTVNILEQGSTPTTYDGGFGGTISVVLAPVTTLITVLDAITQAPVKDARVYLNSSGGSPPTRTYIFGTGGTLTDVNGQVSDTRSLGADLPVVGRVRRATQTLGSPLNETRYKTGILSGTIDSDTGLSITVFLIPDE